MSPGAGPRRGGPGRLLRPDVSQMVVIRPQEPRGRDSCRGLVVARVRAAAAPLVVAAPEEHLTYL
jgi:hypothetical protein